MSNNQRIFQSKSSQNDRTSRNRLSDLYQGEYCRSVAKILQFHPQEGYETPIGEPNGSSEVRRIGARRTDSFGSRHDLMRATALKMIKCRASQAAEETRSFRCLQLNTYIIQFDTIFSSLVSTSRRCNCPVSGAQYANSALCIIGNKGIYRR